MWATTIMFTTNQYTNQSRNGTDKLPGEERDEQEINDWWCRTGKSK